MIRRVAKFGLIAAIAFAPVGCDDDDDDSFTGPSSAPADHTISRDGVRHLAGLTNPQENCVACHGADSRGGESAPSCFTCHGQVWP